MPTQRPASKRTRRASSTATPRARRAEAPALSAPEPAADRRPPPQLKLEFSKPTHSEHDFSDAQLSTVRSALLSYFDAQARDLPWRRTRDPYAIWVSEVMLQQTRVDTVLGYYDRFLKQFPDLPSLAHAEPDAVLAAWSGLGYYRRARLLHAGVREVLTRYGGEVPADAQARRSLPGVGRYTAGAIGSIAFDRCEPLVDGNVARVFARLFGIDTPLSRTDTQAQLWSLAERLVVGPRPGTLNQALMELGAIVCTKAAPSCNHCPVRKQCRAYADDRVQELPVVLKKRPPEARELVAVLAVVRAAKAPRVQHAAASKHDPASDERLLLVRADAGLFAGLWNLPMAEGHSRAHAKQLLSALGLSARVPRDPAAHIEHILTHRKLSIQLFLAQLTHEELTQTLTDGVRLQPRAQLGELGLSALTRKAMAFWPERPSDTSQNTPRSQPTPHART